MSGLGDDHHGEMVAAKVTTGNVHDTQPVRELADVERNSMIVA